MNFEICSRTLRSHFFLFCFFLALWNDGSLEETESLGASSLLKWNKGLRRGISSLYRGDKEGKICGWYLFYFTRLCVCRYKETKFVEYLKHASHHITSPSHLIVTCRLLTAFSAFSSPPLILLWLQTYKFALWKTQESLLNLLDSVWVSEWAGLSSWIYSWSDACSYFWNYFSLKCQIQQTKERPRRGRAEQQAFIMSSPLYHFRLGKWQE